MNYKCACVRAGDASPTALSPAKWLRSVHSPLRSVQKHQQHRQQKEIRGLQREGNCRGAKQLCYRRRCKLLLLSLLFTFKVYPFAIGTDEKWKGGNCKTYVSKIRRVLCRTRLINSTVRVLFKTRLIFSRINGPNKVQGNTRVTATTCSVGEVLIMGQQVPYFGLRKSWQTEKNSQAIFSQLLKLRK